LCFWLRMCVFVWAVRLEFTLCNVSALFLIVINPLSERVKNTLKTSRIHPIYS
jgi:hypothetical protein